jgi:chitin synthase
MKNTGPGGVPVQAHLFEYTTSFALDPEYNYDFGKSKGKQIVPCQILFCLKENNERKINSHRCESSCRFRLRGPGADGTRTGFFNAFAATLEPNVCILLDVSERRSFHYLQSGTDAFHLSL